MISKAIRKKDYGKFKSFMEKHINDEVKATSLDVIMETDSPDLIENRVISESKRVKRAKKILIKLESELKTNFKENFKMVDANSVFKIVKNNKRLLLNFNSFMLEKRTKRSALNFVNEYLNKHIQVNL